MTGDEVLRLLAHITVLDPRWKVEGELEARLQVRAWNEVLTDVAYSWATAAVTRYYSTEQRWSITPGWLHDQWLANLRDAAPASGERACNLARLCRCSHAPGVCFQGWVDVPTESAIHRAGKAHDIVRPCSDCWAAKNAKRAERGEAPVPYPVAPGRPQG